MITILQKRQDLSITFKWCKKNVQSACAFRQSFTASTYGHSQPTQTHLSRRWHTEAIIRLETSYEFAQLFCFWPGDFSFLGATRVREVLWNKSHIHLNKMCEEPHMRFQRLLLSKSVENLSTICNTPIHTLRNQKKRHTYHSIKQWTVNDLQESPDHSVTALQNGLEKPYHGVKKQREGSWG